MPALIHPIATRQAAERQPSLLLLVLAYFSVAQGLTQLSRGLVSWAPGATFAARHSEVYSVGFFVLQTSLLAGLAVYLSLRYSSALWIPQPPLRSSSMLWLAAALPLLLYYAIPLLSKSESFISLWAFSANPEAASTIAPHFHKIWDALPYRSEWHGIFLSSLTSFTAPICEEILFSGVLANLMLRRFGALAAWFGVPACFAFCHGFQFGWGPHLLPLYFAGITYLTIRLTTGSIFWAIAAHLLTNFLVFLPKWAFAAYYFRATQ